MQGRLNSMSKELGDYKLIEKSEVEVARRKAPSAVFTQGGDRGTIVNHNVLLIDGNSAYLFALIAPQEEFAGLGPVLKRILDSFELIP